LTVRIVADYGNLTSALVGRINCHVLRFEVLMKLLKQQYNNTNFKVKLFVDFNKDFF
jgi:hypothetical protein